MHFSGSLIGLYVTVLRQTDLFFNGLLFGFTCNFHCETQDYFVCLIDGLNVSNGAFIEGSKHLILLQI